MPFDQDWPTHYDIKLPPPVPYTPGTLGDRAGTPDWHAVLKRLGAILGWAKDHVIGHGDVAPQSPGEVANPARQAQLEQALRSVTNYQQGNAGGAGHDAPPLTQLADEPAVVPTRFDEQLGPQVPTQNLVPQAPAPGPEAAPAPGTPAGIDPTEFLRERAHAQADYGQANMPLQPVPPATPPQGDVPPALLPPESSAPGGSGGGALGNIQEVLKYALPALAAAVSAKQGTGLGSFTGGYLDAEKHQADINDKNQQRGLQRELINRQIAQQAREEARQHRIEAAQLDQHIRAQQAAKDKEIHDSIQHWMDRTVDSNPEFMDKVNAVGPDKFMINVPGMPPMNLDEAFKRLYVPKGPEGYIYGGKREPLVPVPGDDGGPVYGSPKKGEPVYEKPPANEEALVPTPGPNGSPVYGKKKAGAPVYEKPEKVAKETTRSYNWKDDDPTSDTWGQSFRIVEDNQGNEISRKKITGAGAEGVEAAPKKKSNIKSITPIP